MSTTLLAAPPPAVAAPERVEAPADAPAGAPAVTADELDWEENQRGGGGGLVLWAVCSLVTAGMGTAVAWWWSQLVR